MPTQLISGSRGGGKTEKQKATLKKLGAAKDGQARILHFPEPKNPEEKEDKVGTEISSGQFLYEVFKIERNRQGYPEPKWEQMAEMQTLVWHRIAEVLSKMNG